MSTGAILFTDMVDSTALRTRLGDDRADMLRQHHDQLLTGVIQERRGTVLRWTGDGVKAGFSTSSDALSAAVEIQRAVGAYGRQDDSVAVFQVRIGLSAGEMTIDEGGDYRGIAVIEAARLEALARPGEILASDMIRILGHRRATVGFEEVGERDLKGLDRPVLVHRVIDLETGGALPVPRLFVADQRLPLVGRDRQVQEFRACWESARVGTAGLMLVRGQPGIGKTRFVSHCANVSHDGGATVLGGPCSSDVGVPYEPFAVAFQAVAGIDETVSEAINSGSGSLARLFPGSTSSHSENQPVLARRELFDAVAALIRRLARTRPVLLIVDDLHWATAPTVLLLRHLLDELGDQRLLILGAFREGDIDAAHPVRDLLAAVRSSPNTIVSDLGVLLESDIAQLVTSLAPAAPISRIAGIAEMVCAESSGNPFFASELLRHLATSGQLHEAIKGGAADRLPIPDSVHNVVSQRLAQLPVGANDVLTLAAVIGPTFNLDLVAHVANKSPDDVLDLLDGVTRAGLVTEIGIDQFAFVHAIVRSTLLDELTASRRARAHRRVAEALEARGAEQFDELARHWQLGGEESKATKHLARAARRDMVALAYESAKTRYSQVIELLTRDAHSSVVDRAEAWLGLGAATRALGDPTFTQPIARAGRLARSARNAALMTEAASLSTFLGTAFFIAEAPDVELIELCEDAISLLPDTDPMRVRLLATLASHLTFTPERQPRVKLIDEATELAAQHAEAHLTAEVLNAEFACLWEPATLDRREQIARQLGRLARATGDSSIEFLSGFFAAYCLVERGDLPAARVRLNELDPIVAASRNQYFEFLTERLALTIDLARCVPEAQMRADRFLDKYSAAHVDAQDTWMLHTGILAQRAGQFGQMVNATQSMTTGNKAKLWSSAYAMALYSLGDAAGANEVLDQAGQISKNYFWMVVSQVFAEVAAGLGRVDLCRKFYDELLPFRGRMGIMGAGSVCFGLSSRTLGVLALALGETAAAIDLLSEAIEQADRIGATFDAVTSRRFLATAYLAAGDPARVTGHLHVDLTNALRLADDHGFLEEAIHLRRLLGGQS